MKPYRPAMARLEGVSGHFRVGQIVDLEAGKVLSFEQLIDRIKPKDLIFVGEVHDNPEHHLIQVQIFQALVDCCGPLTLAMEFFQEPQQPSLDRYIQEGLTESEFLVEVNWREGWGFDYHFYRPLMLLARKSESKILAINAPYEIVKKVARRGLKNLDSVERAQLPRHIDLNNKAHRTYVRKAYAQHEQKELANFEYFYEAQCVWEDAMAHNLAEYLRSNKRKILVFTGNGHIINKFGIPHRTVKRHPASMVTIMPYPLNEDVALEKKAADYVWLTANYPHRPKMSYEAKGGGNAE